MRRVAGKDLKQIKLFFEAAAKVAGQATCYRAKCGSVIVKDGIVIGTGYNSPPQHDETRRTCGIVWDHTKKPKYDKTCCVHAEWRAVLDACKSNSGKLSGSALYFMRLDGNGSFTDAGDPFCTTCSRLAMEAGINEFGLWNNNGADIYPITEYDQKSYSYFSV